MPIPIPTRQVGAFFGNRSAHLQIEVFADIQCPFSAKAWPTIRAIMTHYGEERIGVSVKMMVLADHRQAFDMTRALTALAAGVDSKYLDFATYLYEHQECFFNGSFSNKTHADLLALCAEMANGFDGRDRAIFSDVMKSDEAYADTKHSFRTAALRGVWSTPTFFLNGAELTEFGSRSSLDDWRALLDPLISE